MRKIIASLFLVTVILAPLGCSGFKSGICSRGSLFPSTRQNQITSPMITGETVVYETSSACCMDACCPTVCDPCCGTSGGTTTFTPGPIQQLGF